MGQRLSLGGNARRVRASFGYSARLGEGPHRRKGSSANDGGNGDQAVLSMSCVVRLYNVRVHNVM